nr:hypothetical protein [Clostridium scatologenes]
MLQVLGSMTSINVNRLTHTSLAESKKLHLFLPKHLKKGSIVIAGF